MNGTILVTGATGNVGRELTQLLRNAGQPVRAAVVSAADAANLPEGVPWALFDFTDPATYTPAFAGVDRLFLMRPPHIDHDDIFVSAGRGKTAFVDVRDIAAVAARILTEPGHAQQAYPLTGGEALDYGAVAALMSSALARPIGYSQPHFLRFAWRFWRRGHPLGYVAVMTAIYLTTRLGMAETVHPETAVLLERPPITMRQFINDYATVWRNTPRPQDKQTILIGG